LFLLILSVFVITGCGDDGGHHHGGGGGGGAEGETIRPTVVSTVPANLATLVPVNRHITATFSEKMDPATITTATFTVTDPTATLVPGVVTYVGLVATFNPTGNLADDTLYTATITTGAKDRAGNRLASNYVWSFTTGVLADADTTAPIVSSTIPANLARACFRYRDLRGYHRDLQSGQQSLTQHQLYGYDHHRGRGPGKQCTGK
jgi:hypothetical protein